MAPTHVLVKCRVGGKVELVFGAFEGLALRQVLEEGLARRESGRALIAGTRMRGL